MKAFFATALMTAALLGAVPAGAADRDPSRDDMPTIKKFEPKRNSGAPDNSQRNAKDGRLALTAEDQANDDRSLELTRTIRKNILNRSEFSTYAKNVKIIADGSGAVTLRGPVRTMEEKNEIARIASAATGTSRVNNELEIAPHS